MEVIRLFASLSSIFGIPEERVAMEGSLYPDLMRAASTEPEGGEG